MPPTWPDRGHGPALPQWSPSRVPAFWILAVVTAVAALATLGGGALIAVSTPWTALVTALLMVVVASAWLAALLGLDPIERRPGWLVGAALLWGASVAAAVGGGAGYAVDVALAKAVSPDFAAQWGAALAAPYAEEIGKGAGVVMVMLVARPYVITVWSGAWYGAVVGLGFALTEDAGYAMIAADEVLPDDAGAAVEMIVLRLLVPGLVGHPLFTAAAGAGVAYAWLRRDRSARRRFGGLAFGVGGAMVMHAVVNSPLAFGATELLSRLPYASFWGGYIAVVTGVSLPWLRWLIRVRRNDARLLLSGAATLAPDAVLADEVATLSGLRSRFRRIRRVRRDHGVAAATYARRLVRAQVGLAAALARPDQGRPPVASGWLAPAARSLRQEAIEARAALPPALPPALEAAPPAAPPAALAGVLGPVLRAETPEPDRSLGDAGRGLPRSVGPRTAFAAVGTIVCAVAGLLWWPFIAVAAIGAVALVARRRGGSLVFGAVAGTAFVGYCGLVTLLAIALEVQ